MGWLISGTACEGEILGLLLITKVNAQPLVIIFIGPSLNPGVCRKTQLGGADLAGFSSSSSGSFSAPASPGSGSARLGFGLGSATPRGAQRPTRRPRCAGRAASLPH